MEQILSQFRALADPTRLRIVFLIRQLELSVGELVQILEQSQPRVSRHVKILDEAGILSRAKEGSWVFLRPGPALQQGHFDPLFAGVEQQGVTAEDLMRLEKVRGGRAQMAERYFAQHAKQWDELRSMHVAESEVEQNMTALLDPLPLGAMLDVGTGTGRMIELFAKRSDHFTALDSNSEMLRIARAKLAELVPAKFDAERVEIMLGDFNALPIADNSYDTILFHQVLHYAQNPARVIGEAARVLRPGGSMMIVDFAAHDNEELRSVHAHARLGFSDAQIEDAFAGNGIRLAHKKDLDGGDLIVKIWLGRDAESDIKKPNKHNKNNKLRIVA